MRYAGDNVGGGPLKGLGPLHGLFQPNWDALIRGDSGYASWLAQRPGREGNLASARAAAIRRALFAFGGQLPAGFKDAYGDVRQEDLVAAKNNPGGAETILKQNYKTGIRDMRRALAAHGLLQSSDLSTQQGHQDQAKTLAEQTAIQALLAAVTQAVSGPEGYTAGMQGIANEQPGEIGAAKGRLQDAGYKATEEDAPYVPGSFEQYGFAVYKSSDGQLWKQGPNGPEKLGAAAA